MKQEETAKYQGKVVACDCEYENDALVGIGFYTPEQQDYILIEKTGMESFRLIKQIFSGAKALLFHYVLADMEILDRVGIRLDINKVEDTCLMAWVQNSGDLIGLAPQVNKRFGKERPPKNKFNKFLRECGAKSLRDVPYEQQKEYCVEDCEDCYNLYYDIEFTPDEQRVYAKEKKLLPVVLKMNNTGMKIDRGELMKLKGMYLENLEMTKSLIFDMAGEEFNISSPQQVGHVLYDVLDIKPLAMTPGGAHSTDMKTLKQLSTKSLIVLRLLEYRTMNKLITTYLEPILKLTEFGVRLKTHFNPFGTKTGRFSSSNPINMQNIPRDDSMVRGGSIRRCFIPNKGSKFLVGDYSQIELRLLAHYSKDPVMLDVFRTGRDMHDETAAFLGVARQVGKKLNFAIVYGMSPYSLALELECYPLEASGLMRQYFSKLKVMDTWRRDFKRQVADSGGDVVFPNGRIIRDAKPRECVDYICQGTAADICKQAMWNWSRASNIPMSLQIHDELVIECPEKEVFWEAKRLKECMEKAGAGYSVPIVANVSVCDSWGEK